ncbi:MFS transporter [Nocardia flavorosea]|uniref:MFS transporter n=1 Tax=Nocardia flavorosea TaxID=53429 RepID=A0A846YJW9_9NOCA|nr:MFS transporter [Nocardia flavorosea]NKY57199.1 MFS transporter [Nocardia flavorosea]
MRNGSITAVLAAIFVCAWGGNQFTPLLVMYRDAGYSALTVNALLGAYVVGLVPGLLLAGTSAGRFGRRPVALAGVLASLIASLLLAAGTFGVGWIAAGRLVTGFGVAVAMAVGTTWATELCFRSGADPGTGARWAALCLTAGFALGAAVAGGLAQWGPAPMVTPYLVHALLTLAILPFLFRAPETRPLGSPTRGQFGGLRHPRFRRVIMPMAPWIFGSAAVAYAIMPQLVGDRVGRWSLLYSTALTVGTLVAGTLVQPLAKRLDRTSSARAVLVSMMLMPLGLLVSMFAAIVRSPALALVAAIALGCAYGIALVSGLLELQRLAAPHELAALTGAYYALAYLGFLLPSLLSLLNSVAGYPVLLGGLVLVALSGTAMILCHSRTHLPARVAADVTDKELAPAG